MTSIGRGQANAPDRLRLFLYDNAGAPKNATTISYRILSLIDGEPGDEVVAPTNALPGKFDEGAYYAIGYKPAADADLGAHRIEWTYNLGAGAVVATENFEVVASAAFAADPLYASVADVRAAGISVSPPTAADVESALRLWQEAILRVTRQWFHPVALDLPLEGSNTPLIQFSVPVISVDEVYLNGASSPLDSASYAVNVVTQRYRAISDNPGLRLINSSSDFFANPGGDCGNVFRAGVLSRIVGVFGKVEPDGSTPRLIQRALLRLVIEKLSAGVYQPPAGLSPPPVIGAVVEEWTDGHRLKFSDPAVAASAEGISGLTNDPEVKQILKLYKSPLTLGASPVVR